jgi:hypothetical protein
MEKPYTGILTELFSRFIHDYSSYIGLLVATRLSPYNYNIAAMQTIS